VEVKKTVKVISALAVAIAFTASTPHAQQNGSAPGADALRPTEHPRVPADITQLWLAPEPPRGARSAALTDFAAAVKLEVDESFSKALPILSKPEVQQGTLGHYAVYYRGLAQLRLNRADEARATFQSLEARAPLGYLAEAALLREAECDETLGDASAAMDVYDRLSKMKTTSPDDVLMRLGKAAKAIGSTDKATEAFSRLAYEYPYSELATQASAELESLPQAAIVPGTDRYTLTLGRAERLFGAKRHALARTVFETLRRVAQGDDRDLVTLRLAECDYYLKRFRNARDGAKPYTEKGARQAEALYFYAGALRDLKVDEEYQRLVRRIVDEFGATAWAEEALNDFASYYIRQNDDEQADTVFREQYEKFPTGRDAERAAWKIGWWAYKNGRYADTIAAFESAAAHFPRSDYRPSWVYWAARSHEARKEPALADARYALVATDYLNSYYGRLATTHLADRGSRVPPRRIVVDIQRDGRAPEDEIPRVPPPPPNEHMVRALLGLALYDQARDELRYAQKAWGDSPAIQATIGWIEHERGDLRAGINAMKRAYPQYMAAGGEQLPSELLKVLFPVNYWPLIQRYSAERNLDPYLIAALIAQESTFIADAKSKANAYGLMQIVPATGRQYARSLKMPQKFSVGMLTKAETNLKMGTAYFADLVKQFGGEHYALATYNAGPHRVARWISERPGIARDEFIDDIPFPETQNYVKKILGTAEDYRRLYGPDAAKSAAHDQ
jgi:soluble lytic murein transglycosylase